MHHGYNNLKKAIQKLDNNNKKKETPLPMSLLSSGSIRRMIYSKKAEAAELIPKVDWDKYRCDVHGVRYFCSLLFSFFVACLLL